MISFAIGLFIGAFVGFVLAAILAMSRDSDEYARKNHYRRGLGSGADLCAGRLELLGRLGAATYVLPADGIAAALSNLVGGMEKGNLS